MELLGKRIVESFLNPALEAKDLPSIEKASAAWQNAVQAENAIREATGLRFWLPRLAPLATALTALVGIVGLLAQAAQFNKNLEVQNQNSELQRQANEGANFREVAKTLQSHEMMNGMIGLPLLKGFIDSKHYAVEARAVALNLMEGMVKFDAFEPLFKAVLVRTDWDNFAELVRLNRRLSKNRDAAHRYAETHPPSRPKPRMLPPLPPDAEPLQGPSPEQAKRDVDEINQELELVVAAVGERLRTGRPPEMKIDLSGTDLWKINLSRADLTGVVLSNALVQDADFTDVSAFEGSSWESTAWWRATRVSPKLLEYLVTRWPYDDKTYYFYFGRITHKDYQKELRRLRQR